ncbi:MAG: TIGR01777 family oxidoreductase [Candidatus Hydrogenedentes bacterium]|nr:TIGR01777 family oxidoreductase [Candidatus Hydrogenedentota bacterium]
MRVLISGATGLIGTALTSQLESEEMDVTQLTRQQVDDEDTHRVYWHPESGTLDAEQVEGFRAVVHLAGENISDAKWTEDKKRRILSSRVSSTTLLCRVLANLKKKPKTLICASAVGYYGGRGDEELTESAEPGKGFLAEVCQAWEQAVLPATEAGIRVTFLRMGVVLSAHGGALQRMLPPFRLGLGGPVGGGMQQMSWITLDDLTRAILYCIKNRRMTGVVNAVTPHPVRNRKFAQELGKAVGKPAVIPVPAFAINLAWGEMGRELLLSSTHAVPERLTQSGFEWHYPEIEDALRACIEGET